MNVLHVEALTLLRNAVAILDRHTSHTHFAGPWTAQQGNLYGVDPANGQPGYPVAIGGDELGSGLSAEEAEFIARTAGNPRFLRSVRLILTDADRKLEHNRATLGDVADALRLAESIMTPGRLGQHTTTGP